MMPLASGFHLVPLRNTRTKSVGNPTVPAWAQTIANLSSPNPVPIETGFTAGVTRDAHFALATTKIEWATRLDSADFRERTIQAYGWIFNAIAGYSPLRFWNFIPDIHQPQTGSQSRYMVFNAGRFKAFEKQFGDPAHFDQKIATASGVGHAGQHLYIHCLAARERGVHLGNPRQVSPHRYSSRFGKRPPCFARATFLPDRKLLLIGGTASIGGEESLHDNLAAQMNETLLNLSQLIHSAAKNCDCSCGIDALGSITDMRIYHTRPGDEKPLEQMLRNRVEHLGRIEFVQADLCRPELLVEIEGIAQMTSHVSDLIGVAEP